MRIAAILLALCVLATDSSIAAAAAASPAASSGVTVVEQPNPSSDLVGTEVLLQAGLDRQTPRQNGLAALVAETILHTPVRAHLRWLARR